MKLTPKQEAFAVEVARGASQSDAVRRAYPRTQQWKPEAVWSKGSHMMATAKVAARVAELRAPAVAQAQIDTAWVLARLVTVVERSMQAVPAYDRDGVTIAFDFDAAAATRALDLIADYTGGFARRHEHSGPGGGAIPLLAGVVRLTERQLALIVEGARGGR